MRSGEEICARTVLKRVWMEAEGNEAESGFSERWRAKHIS